MSEEIIKSDKLRYTSYIPAVNLDPIDVMEQVVTNSTYTSSGYGFNIKSPAKGLLLDPDIWIKYTINIVEAAAGSLAQNYFTYNNADNTFANLFAQTDIRVALRGGPVMQKATSNIILTINGTAISIEPWQYSEVLSRLHHSDKQSEHEFSASGGPFDCGNHSHRTTSDLSSAGRSIANGAPNGTLGLNIINGHHTLAELVATPAAADVNRLVAINHCPSNKHFFNDGFNNRYWRLVDITRHVVGPRANTGNQYMAGGGIAVQTYTIEIKERLAIPPFKMFSNDNVDGMLPNINDIKITANFTANLTASILRSSAAIAGVCSVQIPANASASSMCELYVKWITPPVTVMIPKEVSIPLRKINFWSENFTIGALDPDTAINYFSGAATNPVSYSNYSISLDAVPDLLLIYIQVRPDARAATDPDTYMLELTNLEIGLEGRACKLSQIQTIDLYNKWKNHLAYRNSDIPPFDEWRKYQCVACLKPEDYGILKGPGYDNPVTLSIRVTPRIYWNIYKMGLVANENYNSTNFQVCVVSIYDKWRLTLMESGGAQADLTRISPTVFAAINNSGMSVSEPINLRGMI